MSESKVPDDAESVPDFERLERDAIPATYRRAPLLTRIVGSGIAFGVGLGIVLGVAMPNSTGVGRGMVALLMALGFGMIGGLTAGAIATRMDAHSLNAARKAQRGDRDAKEKRT